MFTQNTSGKLASDPLGEAIEQLRQGRNDLLAQAQNIDRAIANLSSLHSSRGAAASPFDSVSQQLSSRLTGAGLSPEDLLATLPEARKRVYAERYGKKRSGNTNNRRNPRGK
jgi:ABC-type transporter Mla subunit MlaD